MTSDFEELSISDFIHYIYFPIFILQKEPVFSIFNVECQTRELPVPFYNVFGRPPALEASTLPLGCQGGGVIKDNI